jgi:2-dehydro-3-deoxyphosphogluconate aldolase/(4S)-4-hydroxy-2-oxoglutarate aldolase
VKEAALSNPQHLLDQVVAHGVVPVIRTSSLELARTSVGWLKEAGFRTFEITMSIPDAPSLIEELSHDTDLLIGAGTVFTAAEVDRVVAAGAKYVVSPCVSTEVGAACRRLDVPSLMGTLTPTEVYNALLAGTTAVKVFPASTVGPGHLKALRSVFPKVTFMPTGGVDASTIADWVKAGAACVGVGGKLVDEGIIRSGDKATVLKVGKQLIEAYKAART